MEASANAAPNELVLTSVAGTEARMEIAGLGARSFAFIIDWHIRLLVALVWLAAATFLVTGGSGDPLGSGGAWQVWVAVTPTFAIYFLYHPVLECFGGTTPGKRYAGVRIVTRDGLVPGIGAILLRNLARLVDSMPLFYVIGVIVALVDGRARRLGDMVAGTLLVRAEDRVEQVFGALSERSGSTLDPSLAEVATELLDRWKTLTPARRAELGRRVLERAGAASTSGDDAAVRADVEALLARRA